MNGLQSSNFKRIYKGLLMDLILTFIISIVFIFLIKLIDSQMLAAGIEESAEVSMDVVEASSPFGMKLLFVFMSLKYVFAALCALYIISGLGETEIISSHLTASKNFFISYLIANAVFIIVRVSRVATSGTRNATLAELLFLIFDGFIIWVKAMALHYLCMGYAHIFADINLPGRQKKALSLSKHIMIAGFIDLAYILADIVFTALGKVHDVIEIILEIVDGVGDLYFWATAVLIIILSRTIYKEVSVLSE